LRRTDDTLPWPRFSHYEPTVVQRLIGRQIARSRDSVRQIGQRAGERAATWILTAVLLATAACKRSPGSKSSGAERPGRQSLADIPADQSRAAVTERRQYFLEVEPRPNPIPFQELFELRVRVWQSDARERPVETARLDDVRARMPAHDHGMKTAPESERTGSGEFTVQGMRFHMQGLGEDGRWVVEVVVDGPAGIDRASFEVQCCRPDG